MKRQFYALILLATAPFAVANAATRNNVTPDPLCSSETFVQSSNLLQQQQDVFNSLWNQLSEGQTVETLMAQATPEYCLAIGKDSLEMWMLENSLPKPRFSDFIKKLHSVGTTLSETCQSRETQSFLANAIWSQIEDIQTDVKELNRKLGCY